MLRWKKSCLLALLGCAGCVERTLTVTSNPPGALVYLNDQEVGRTPLTRNFLWYGTYDLQIRKDGYKTIDARPRVWAPLWQIVPIDLVAELFPLPLVDRHRLSYTMKPVSEASFDPHALAARGIRERKKLRSSEYRPPTTLPSSQPTEGMSNSASPTAAG